MQCIGFGAIKSLKSKSNPKNLRILIGFLNLVATRGLTLPMLCVRQLFPLTCQLLCLMHGAWYRTAGTALRDLFYFAVLSGNSAWRLFSIKQSCPARKGTLLRQAPPRGRVIENGAYWSLFVRSPRAFSKSPSPCCIAR